MLNLKDLVIDTKEVEVAFPAFEGFKVKVKYVSRAASKKLLEDSEVKEFKQGMIVDTRRDEDKFASAFSSHCITGWSGLTLDIVSRLMLIDLQGQDPDTIVEYSKDNAFMLMKNSVAFSRFIDDTVFDLDTFR